MVSHFVFEEQTVMKREVEEEGEEQRYGSLGFCMEKLWILVWNVWNLCTELWMGVYVLGILVVFWIWVS